MPTVKEKPPRNLLREDYRPDDSAPIYVGGKNGGAPTDTWQSVAGQYQMDVHELIRFNFKTNDTDEVNWYLRMRVGCRMPSPSGHNWTFTDADPGMIYIPQLRIRFAPEVIEGNPGVHVDYGQVAKDLRKMFKHGGWQMVGQILDILSAADLALAIAEVGMPLAFVAGMPLAGFAAVMLSLGSPHLDAFDKIKQDQVLWGFAYGVVLGINKKSGPFIQGHGFDRRPINSSVYPNRERDFQAAYQVGLALGLALGRKKLNPPQQKALIRDLRQYIDLGKYPTSDKWPSKDLRNYFIDMATAFRRYKLKL